MDASRLFIPGLSAGRVQGLAVFLFLLVGCNGAGLVIAHDERKEDYNRI